MSFVANESGSRGALDLTAVWLYLDDFIGFTFIMCGEFVSFVQVLDWDFISHFQVYCFACRHLLAYALILDFRSATCLFTSRSNFVSQVMLKEAISFRIWCLNMNDAGGTLVMLCGVVRYVSKALLASSYLQHHSFVQLF